MSSAYVVGGIAIFSTQMASRIIMITGGQRSGKSRIAERMVLDLSPSPVYIATARVWDEEFQRRVDLHKQRRGPEWTTYEEPLHVDNLPVDTHDIILFDCVTLWATNWFFECGEDSDRALAEMKSRVDSLVSQCSNIVFVTNEIGLGGVAENGLQRRFTDLQGLINQYIAEIADEVHLAVSGIDVRIK